MGMVIRVSNEWVAKLTKLMCENPDLPVLCRVDSEIVADDGYAWWIGRLDERFEPEIDEYATRFRGELICKSEGDYESWFEEFFDAEDYRDIPDSDWAEFVREKVDKVAGWKRAIFISVTTTVC